MVKNEKQSIAKNSMFNTMMHNARIGK